MIMNFPSIVSELNFDFRISLIFLGEGDLIDFVQLPHSFRKPRQKHVFLICAVTFHIFLNDLNEKEKMQVKVASGL